MLQLCTEDLAAFTAAGGKPVSNQLPYNLLFRTIESGILPACIDKNTGVLTYSSLQQALLTGKFTDPVVFRICKLHTRTVLRTSSYPHTRSNERESQIEGHFLCLPLPISRWPFVVPESTVPEGRACSCIDTELVHQKLISGPENTVDVFLLRVVQRRTRLFAGDSTPKSRHGGPGVEVEPLNNFSTAENCRLTDGALVW